MDKIRKLKKAKKSIPIVKKEMIKMYSIQCPHCQTFLRGGITRDIDRLFCYHCKNPIILSWEEILENA